ncbi:MAG: phage integrase central domain-containing protein [Acidimicrobiales bacterium]
MSGNLRPLRNGVWEARIDAGRDPVTGKRRQVSRTVYGTKREAQKVLNEMAVEADRGEFTGTAATFGELCDRWIELATGDLSPVTIRNYRDLLKNHITPALGDIPLKNIRTIDLDRLYHALQDQRGATASTVRHIHSVIRRAFRQAILWGWVATNPAANASQPRLAKPDISPPDVGQVGEILRAANESDAELGHLLHLAATTGARRGELCALRWSDIDIERSSLSISRSIIEVAGGVFEKDTKTHSSRRIALDEGSIEVIGAQRRLFTERASIAGGLLGEDAFVFSRDPEGSVPWRPDHVTKAFAAIRDSLGYKGVRFHDYADIFVMPTFWRTASSSVVSAQKLSA